MQPRIGDTVYFWEAGYEGDPLAAIVVRLNRSQHGETQPTVDLRVFPPDRLPGTRAGSYDVTGVHGPDTDLRRNNARARWAWRDDA